MNDSQQDKLISEVWRSLFELYKYRQEKELPCDYASVIVRELGFNANILNRIPDLRGVDIDNELVDSWLFFESLPQDERRGIEIQTESEYNLQATSLPGEEWKLIEEFPHYLISNLGRVWSLRRRQGLMKPQFRNTGRRHRSKNPDKWRLFVQLHDYKTGRQRKFLVHRLVAQAFVPNPNNYPHIDHIDENPQNNRADNLRWCTLEQNLKFYAERHYADPQGTCNLSEEIA